MTIKLKSFTTGILLLFATVLVAQQVVSADALTTKDLNGQTITYFGEEPFTGFSIQQKNGKTVSWITFKNGMANGHWQEWYENGNLRFDAYWKDGKGHGQWRYFHENGKIRQEEFYDMDSAVGLFRNYWSNGKIRLLSSWLNGEKHGFWTYYDNSGSIVKKETYENGEIMGAKSEM